MPMDTMEYWSLVQMHSLYKDTLVQMHSLYKDTLVQMHSLYKDTLVQMHSLYKDTLVQMHSVYKDTLVQMHSVYKDTLVLFGSLYAYCSHPELNGASSLQRMSATGSHGYVRCNTTHHHGLTLLVCTVVEVCWLLVAYVNEVDQRVHVLELAICLI